MRSARSVLALRYTPVSIAGGVRKAVGGFLRYVQFRDQHVEPEHDGGLDAYVRYVAHRDRTSPGGRVFGEDGGRTDGDRRRLVDFVIRSTRGLEPKWVKCLDGKLEDRQRAVYTLVLSPEDWRGLDLRRVARTAMKQLESDAGSDGIGPWFAAEHRNTAHHHVHIVLAARREVAPGRFTTLVISRARLQRMKEAIAVEIDQQRSFLRDTDQVRASERPSLGARACRLSWLPAPRQRRPAGRSFHRRLNVHAVNRPSGWPVGEALLRIRGVVLRYRLQLERELEAEQVRRDPEGWER
jgi:hypothetical protein